MHFKRNFMNVFAFNLIWWYLLQSLEIKENLGACQRYPQSLELEYRNMLLFRGEYPHTHTHTIGPKWAKGKEIGCSFPFSSDSVSWLVMSFCLYVWLCKESYQVEVFREQALTNNHHFFHMKTIQIWKILEKKAWSNGSREKIVICWKVEIAIWIVRPYLKFE